MTRKIFLSIMAAAAVVLLCSVLIIMGCLYDYFGGVQERQLEDELALAQTGVECSGKTYLKALEGESYRLTWIAPSGEVLFDSQADESSMENHAQREEVRQALETGEGQSSRYSMPGQDLQDWQETLDNVLRLNPEHVSCYALKIEEGTPFYDYKEMLNLPDDETQADMYLAAVEALRSRGFRQYEISNFARKGLYSRHNMKYWTGGEYLGFGPSASSDFAGKRFTLKRDLQEYIAGIRDGGDIMEDLQEIPMRERAGEYLMLRLRTSQGISAAEYEKLFLLPFAPLEDVLEKRRRYYQATQNDSGRWVLTPQGYLVSNDIITDLLIAQDSSHPLKRI